jgi:glycosyltransferase 2 family protein
MKRMRLWIRWALSVGLIVFLFLTIDVRDLLDSLNRSRPIFFLVAYLIALGDRFMMAFKWSILLRANNINIPLLNITGTYVISTFLGLFLPATIGGDALRAYGVSRDGHKGAVVVSSIVIERVLGFLALFVFMLISVALSVFAFGSHFFDGIWQVFWLVFGLLAGLSLAIFVSLNESFAKRIGGWISDSRVGGPAFRSPKLAGKLQEIYASYLAYQDRKPQLFVFFVLSLIENLFPLFWTYSLSLAFGIEVPLLYFFILVPIVLALVRLPISLDGFGLQEGAFVYFLGLIGVARPEALLLGLASHFLAILSVLPGGILYALGGLTLHVEPEGRPEEVGPHAAGVASPLANQENKPAAAMKVNVGD